MSYQVLARKWRPHGFDRVVGQGHVLRALVNALDSDRLHHAYLFTGTRGVGKTSLARVFAKALNCEQGVSSTPCGECSSCVEVDEGRFVDLIEVDAASRTKVDETRDLLDNVQYAPTRGRYKIYLIDEVHMFSTHSFNALLKTLEEPPPHVKFLLATTDPKKLPVTILSRCLQFNLKRVGVEQLREHLRMIVDAEGVGTDDASLALLAHAADGSVRDSLSLLDQAIAYGAGTLTQPDVATMLGTIGAAEVEQMVDAMSRSDGGQLIEYARALAESAPDYHHVLGEILSLLRRIAVWQAVGGESADLAEDDAVVRLAGQMSPEDCQLFYQIGLIGRRDLALAPDPQSGFEMVLLRMVAFRPADAADTPLREAAKKAPTAGKQPVVTAPAPPASEPPPASAPAPAPSAPAPVGERKEPAVTQPAQPGEPEGKPAPVAAATASDRDGGEHFDWNELVGKLQLHGFTRELARNAALKTYNGSIVELVVARQHENLKAGGAVAGLESALRDQLKVDVRIRLSIAADEELDTPSKRMTAAEQERQRQAEQNIGEDPTVRTLQNEFGATIEQVQPK